ncbi:DUF6350 family protein [Gryllotalpicola reticulitermitis]|uniref:DUF6350 family protein n=1 Tax=Gryllotalpicola reticulitermitis TaxID=1184153 RepID=A0ABV8Q4K9_9MICO
MTRPLVVFLAAFEAVITAAIGIGVALAPLTVVWALQYHMETSWGTFWRAAADAWLLGLGVDLHVDLGQATALSLGLPGAVAPFTVTIAALGVALFTFIMGARVGRRAAETPFVLTGGVASVVVFALIAWFVALSAQTTIVSPASKQAAFIAGLTFAAGVALGIGLDWAREREHVPSWIARRLGPTARAVVGAAVRGAVGSVALLVAASAVLVALLLVTHFGKAVGLYEALQSGYLGGVTLTLAQAAFLPNAILWAMSWLIGPGFALGGAVPVAPGSGLSTSLPGIPLMAIVPQHTSAVAFVALAVPVLAAAVIGFLTHRALSGSRAVADGPLELALTALGVAIIGGAIIALLGWWSGGTLAPGMLAHLGPVPWAVGLFGGIELGVGTAIGLTAAHLRNQSMEWTPLARAAQREAPAPEKEPVGPPVG